MQNKNDFPASNEAKGNLLYVYDIRLANHPYIKDLNIDSDNKFSHIIITGRNGVGKSTLLEQLLQAIEKGKKELDTYEQNSFWRRNYLETKQKYVSETDSLVKQSLHNQLLSDLSTVNFQASFCDVKFNSPKAIHLKTHGSAVIAYFPAKRINQVNQISNIGAPEVKVSNPKEDLARTFIQHLANCRSQLAFAESDGDIEDSASLRQWFNNLDSFFTEIFEEETKLIFNRKTFSYTMQKADGSSVDMNHLSEGYAAVVKIVSEIIMRMESIERGNFTLPGIVLIDEIETHLHVSLQKKILPMLKQFFPNIQFIVTTHSPFVLQSIEDALIFDQESNQTIDQADKLWKYSYEALIDGYFEVDKFSNILRDKILRYKVLTSGQELEKIEKKELRQLKKELENVPTFKNATIETELKQLGLK
ncbi:AAA family ATPase [Vibrio splendidus]